MSVLQFRCRMVLETTRGELSAKGIISQSTMFLRWATENVSHRTCLFASILAHKRNWSYCLFCTEEVIVSKKISTSSWIYSRGIYSQNLCLDSSVHTSQVIVNNPNKDSKSSTRKIVYILYVTCYATSYTPILFFKVEKQSQIDTEISGHHPSPGISRM